MRRVRGFTLVELITVIVILAIVAVIGSRFIVVAVDSYRDSEQRAKLLQKGRLAVEQMTRQLRNALPNSVRVSPSGDCIEFIPIAGGGTYLEPVPDTGNNAPISGSSPLNTSAIFRNYWQPRYLAIGALCPEEIYAASTCAGAAAGASSLALLAAPVPADGDNSVSFNEQRFIRNSINRRFFLTDHPMRFCVRNNDLVEHTDYGLIADPMDDSAPGTETLLVSGVAIPGTSAAFRLSGASQDRGAAVFINLVFEQGRSAVELNHQVVVRNVP